MYDLVLYVFDVISCNYITSDKKTLHPIVNLFKEGLTKH